MPYSKFDVGRSLVCILAPLGGLPEASRYAGIDSLSGTFSFSSSSHTVSSESLGARQSPLGDREPPGPTLGPFGRVERLNWLVLKNRCRKIPSHFLIVERSYSACLFSGISFGQWPRFLSPQA